jgi:superfamily II DNA helicase RecQ
LNGFLHFCQEFFLSSASRTANVGLSVQIIDQLIYNWVFYILADFYCIASIVAFLAVMSFSTHHIDSETSTRRVIEDLTQKLQTLYNFPPKPEQVQAIYILSQLKQDLILTAPTGWGKSIIFNSVPVLTSSICLLLVPLKLLAADHGRYINQLQLEHSRALVLDADSNTHENRASITKGTYSHSTSFYINSPGLFIKLN